MNTWPRYRTSVTQHEQHGGGEQFCDGRNSNALQTKTIKCISVITEVYALIHITISRPLKCSVCRKGELINSKQLIVNNFAQEALQSLVKNKKRTNLHAVNGGRRCGRKRVRRAVPLAPHDFLIVNHNSN